MKQVKIDKDQIVIRHFKFAKENGEFSNFGGFTVGLYYNKTNQNVIAALSVTHKRDIFCKKIGVENVVHRINAVLDISVEATETDHEFTRVIEKHQIVDIDIDTSFLTDSLNERMNDENCKDPVKEEILKVFAVLHHKFNAFDITDFKYDAVLNTFAFLMSYKYPILLDFCPDPKTKELIKMVGI